MNDNERWLTDGNCGKCRREKYCSKPCRAQKLRKERIMAEFIRKKTGIGKVESRIEELIRMRDGDEGI